MSQGSPPPPGQIPHCSTKTQVGDSQRERSPWGDSFPPLLPVIPKGVGRRFLPALVGLGVQEAVVSMDGMAQIIPPLLLA